MLNRDLHSRTAIIAKGLLFLLLGVMGLALLILEHPELRVAVFAVIAIWGFCRFYYFAFYVIEKYVDEEYRFAGLWSFLVYLFNRRNRH